MLPFISYVGKIRVLHELGIRLYTVLIIINWARYSTIGVISIAKSSSTKTYDINLKSTSSPLFPPLVSLKFTLVFICCHYLAI